LAVFNVDRAARLGEVTVRAEVARPLTTAQKDRLETLLKGRFGPRYRLEIALDPAALGGLVLRVNSQLIDASLRGKLTHLAQGLSGPPPRAS
jgi:F-type H+-transporting ATPase subunit delta